MSPWMAVPLSFGCQACFTEAGLGTDKGSRKIQIILAELVSAVMVILGCQSLLQFCDQWQMETDGKL